MAKGAGQKLKLIYLYHILLTQTDEDHPLSMEQLLSELERRGVTAERKSIYDDIAALQDFGLDILLRRGRGGGYYVASRTFELAELKLLVDAIQCSRFITEKKSRELIKKLESLISEPQARVLQRQVYVTDRVKTVNEGIYYNVDQLHTAISSGMQITFQYFEWALDFSASQRIQKRYRQGGALYHASPWALTWEDENYYLVAYDHKSGQLRHYRVDKMEHIEVTKLPREGKQLFQDLNIASYAKTMFGMFSGEQKTVRLRCENRFIGVLRDRFGSELMIQKDGEAHFCVNVSVAVSPQFFSWVFGLSGAVQIIAPEEVCSAFQTQLRSLIRE